MEDSVSYILKTDSLEIGYKKKKDQIAIVSGINIEVKKGELVAIIGENGSGKSTLLKTLSGIIQPLQGQYFISGNNIENFDSEEFSKHISLVLTEQTVSRNLEVAELIALGRQPYTNWIGKLTKEDLLHIMKAINLVGLREIKNKKCYELSDGQFQKVLIARALSQDTPLVILDEPTTHLDLYHKAYVLNLLKKLTRETNKAILFATHEINMALQLCDKLLILKNGKSVFGSPSELIEKDALNRLFPESLIYFDKASSSFKVK